MYYAVIDTNVLVSALISRKKNITAPVKIVEYIFDEVIIPVFNEEILEEYKDVLSRKKFNFEIADIEELIFQIKKSGVHENILKSEENFVDEDDRVFFEITLSYLEVEKETYLVTGNLKHFPREPFILTPRQMVAIIEGGSSEH